MTKNLNGAVILKKNKDYQSVEQAQMFYEKQRMTELATVLFPVSEYPEKFKAWMLHLMRYQNPVQMQVWHNKDVVIRDGSGGAISTTWHAMCSFDRPFACAEMYQCLEVLKRATPNEVFNINPIVAPIEEVLQYFNEIAYPELESIVTHIQTVLDEIEEQVCSPIRAKINADLKVMMQLPVGDKVEFIKGKQRRM